MARRLEDVALELFATQGFDETTVDELAVAGGVGRRTFFRYFPTKLDVVLGELDEGLAGARPTSLAAEPGDDPVAAARAAFLAVNHYADAELPALRRRLGLIEDVPELAARATVRYRDWEQALAADAARRWGVDVGGLRAQVFGRAVVAAMRAVFSAWHTRPEAGRRRARRPGRGSVRRPLAGILVDVSDLIDLDPASTDPPYEQLRARISELARTGGLAPAHPPARGAPPRHRPQHRAGHRRPRLPRARGRRGRRDPRAAGHVRRRRPGARPTRRAELAAEYARRVTALGVSPERALDLARAALADP